MIGFTNPNDNTTIAAMVQLVYLLPAPLFGIFTAFLEWVAFHHRQISKHQR